jgi:CDP-6-deoxy-D-xylo-4-hexulose-3-dehydrase
MSATYPLAINTLGAEELAAAHRVLASGRLTMGDQVARFEAEFARYVGSEHALMVNSGSSANLLIIEMLLRRTRAEAPLHGGDEVIVPSLAWPTTVWPIAQLGLVPVLVDIDPNTLAIDLDSAESVVGPRTKAMFMINVLGRLPEMARYVEFCDANGLVFIEDSCETLGAYSGGRHAGTFGVMGSFSSYFSHHLNTIEGGMVVTSDPELLDDLMSARSHGWSRGRSDSLKWQLESPGIDDRFLFVSGGYNVRPTEIQGAIGSVQLARLDSMIEARVRLAQRIADLVSVHAPWLELIGSDRLAEQGPQRSHSWMTLPFRLRRDAPIDVVTLGKFFEGYGVETRPVIAGNIARHPAMRRFEWRAADVLTECDELLENGLMIGCHPEVDASSMATLEGAFEALGSR